jgi:hypothetical protein
MVKRIPICRFSGSGSAPTGGKNVVPLGSAAVERREAPHPYVTGVRAPSHGARGPSP